jgi:glycosyltransferase involved in cell wall biosynthesis/ADP-heptose:LPS heptosyltransferase
VSESSKTLRDIPGPGLTVLQVIPDLETGGAERTAVDIAHAITRAGGRAIVASRGGRLEDELREAGGELIKIPAHTKNPYGIFANIIRLVHIINHFHVDIVHVRSRAPAWSAFAAARLSGRPFVTTYHGTYNARLPIKRFYNSVMARGDLVIANSRFIARHIHDTYGLPESKIVTIPRGTGMDKFDPDQVDHDRVKSMRERWGLSVSPSADERAVVLLPGRLTRWKGQAVLIEAASILKERGRGDDAVFILAGDDQGREAYSNELTRLADEHGLAGRVRIVGHVSDMPAAYLAADIIVAPSVEAEAFGRVAVEAQAMGRPVIAADHGGARETVMTAADDPGAEGLATGWRVPPGDANALADALAEAIDQGIGGRAAMGALGQAHVRETYSLDEMCARTLGVYKRLAGSAAKRRIVATRGLMGPEHILVIKLGALGDFVQAMGPMKAIRTHHPAAHITLLTTAPFSPLAWASGLFDAIWTDGRERSLAGQIRMIKRLRDGEFERVYDLQTSDRSSALYFLMGPHRPEWSGIAPGCSHPHKNPARAEMHTVERQREQLELSGVSDVPLTDLSFALNPARTNISRLGFSTRGDPFALLVPGGSAHRPEKRWPAKHYGQLAKALEERGIRPVVIGTGAERDAADVILGASVGAISLIDKTDFLQIAALAGRAQLAIGNDTGPMHLIVAAGCPSLVLFSDESDPRRCAPRGRMAQVFQAPDLDTIGVDTIIDKLKQADMLPDTPIRVAE